jgi:hypothetical protein
MAPSHPFPSVPPTGARTVPEVGATAPDRHLRSVAPASAHHVRREPPQWKENVLVLVGLYPTVMVFTLLVAPHLEWLGEAPAMLLGNVVTVGLLGWPILGTLRRRLGWWLHAAPGDRRTDRRGALLLATTLVVLTGALQGLAAVLP